MNERNDNLPSGWLSLHRRVFEIVESGRERDQLRHIFDHFLITLIILNVLAFAAETVPSLLAEWHREFYLFELFSVVVFTLEYVALIPNHKKTILCKAVIRASRPGFPFRGRVQ